MADSFTQMLHQWQNFYILVGTASATLIGLTFIAASLGSGLVPRDPASTVVHTWVTPMISHFSAVLFICIFLAMPALSPLLTSIVLGIGGLFGLRYVVQIARRFQQQQGTPIATADLLWHLILPATAYAFILIAAAGLLLSIDQALTILGLALALLLAASIRNTWDLVVWISQQSP